MNGMALQLPPLATANGLWLRQIQRAQRQGETCLPAHLGLSPQEHHSLLRRYPVQGLYGLSEGQRGRNALRQELLELRRDEWADIRALLLGGQGSPAGSEVTWLASIVAAACLGGSHLWRDLGMTSRNQLGELLHSNFPLLARRNTQNMRWKKFFYKQLCERQGNYVCRSPSCDICSTYDDCFGDES